MEKINVLFLLLLLSTTVPTYMLCRCLNAATKCFPPGGEQQIFTLGVVVANPNINENKLADLVNQVQQLSNSFDNTSSRYHAAAAAMSSIRLQLNPVYTTGLGPDKVIQKLFCSPESRGTNAVFILVDQNASSIYNGPLLSHFMTLLSNYAHIPVIAWSTSTADLEQLLPRAELSTLLLPPSIRAHGRAIYEYARSVLPMRKICIIVSLRAPGVEDFLDGLRELEENRRYSRFDFDSTQQLTSSRFIQYVQLDNTLLDNIHIHKELLFLRDATDTRIFVLYLDENTTDKVMEEAHLLGMTTSDYSWLCGKLSFADVPPQNYPPGLIVATYRTSMKAQLTALKAAIRIWSEAVRRLVVNSSRPDDALMPAISCTRFKSPKWNYSQVFHNLLQQRFTKVMTFRDEESGFVGLNEVNFMLLEMNRRWKRIGGWTATEGLTIDDEKWIRRYSDYAQSSGAFIKSSFLRVVTLDEPPYIIYELPMQNGHCPKTAIPCRLAKEQSNKLAHKDMCFDRGNKTNVCCSGYVVDLLRKLSYDIGFQFELFEVPDGKWGTVDQVTGQWNGLVQAILNGSADMVATSLKINTDRSSAIDFSVPFYQTGVTILVRVREGVVSSYAFLEPFSIEIWLVVFVGCVNACALCIFFFENFRNLFQNKNEDDDSEKGQNTSSLFGSFWLVFSMLFNAAMKANTPKSMAGRFLANIWAFVCVIFMSSFMANLAAFMITKEEYYDFSGLDDYRLKNPFTRNPPWRFSTIPYGATEQLIRTNYPEMHEYMRKYMRPDVDEGVAAVQQGYLDAFIYDASVLTYKAGRDKNCQLKTVGKWYAPTGYGFGFPKSSKWTQSINKQLLDYQVSGYLQQLEDYWLSSSCNMHFHKNSHKSTELGIANLASAFAILSGAIIACAVFFGFEHLCAKRRRSMCRKSAWRLITPSLGRALSFKKTATAAFRQTRDVNCTNPNCRIRQQFLQQQLQYRKERVRQLEEEILRESTKREKPSRTINENACPQHPILAEFGSIEDIDTKGSCACNDLKASRSADTV